MDNALPLTWVWRKRGSDSPESLCEFASFAPVRAAVNPRLRQAAPTLAAMAEAAVRSSRKMRFSFFVTKKNDTSKKNRKKIYYLCSRK